MSDTLGRDRSVARDSIIERIKRRKLFAVVVAIAAALLWIVSFQSAATTVLGWLSPYVPAVSHYADARAISNLKPGAHLSTYEKALGEFTYRTEHTPYVEYVFVRPNCYVQVLTDESDRVLMYAVTVRNKEFHPVFEIPGLVDGPASFRLGLSKFAESGLYPDYICGVFGGSYMHYMEFTRFPHVNDFLGVILASSDSGAWWEPADHELSPFNEEDYPTSLNDALAANKPDDPAIKWYRTNEIANTYGEAAPDFDPGVLFEEDGMPKSSLVIGPDRVMVRE